MGPTDVGGDPPDSGCLPPVHKREASLAGIPPPLPRDADHPGDISNFSGVGRGGYGGLHGANSCSIVRRPDDPVEPDIAGLLRSRDESTVAITELVERVGTTADE